MLIYKRTHEGDPDPKTRKFGVWDCMGRVRDRAFDAVIGVGGIGKKAKDSGIAGKVTWVGIGPRKLRARCRFGYVATTVSFDDFKYFGAEGNDLRCEAPMLANRIHGGKIRHMVLDEQHPNELSEALRLLDSSIDRMDSSIDQLARRKRCRVPCDR